MRDAQRSRTRQAIIRAAARLIAQGERPNLDDIAAEAAISRATVYRYFPGLDALLSEAEVDSLVLDPTEVFDPKSPGDAGARLARLDDMFDQVVREGEIALRLMLARILERSATGEPNAVPLRQNRRTPLIELALEPAADQLAPVPRARLVAALAMIIGAESYLALNDVAGLDRKEARVVRHWAIEALFEAAVRESAVARPIKSRARPGSPRNPGSPASVRAG